MGKKAELEPRWLVALLNQWALHDLRAETGALGFSSGSSWMRGLKSSPGSSVDPTGWAAGDFRDLEACLQQLLDADRNLWAALTMYYKAWVVPAFQAEGYPFQVTVYYERLHRAHAVVAANMGLRRSERQVRSVSINARPVQTATFTPEKKSRMGPVAALTVSAHP